MRFWQKARDWADGQSPFHGVEELEARRREEERRCPVHGDEYPYGGVCDCWRDSGVVGRDGWHQQ